jgi:hypothetical protein
VKNAKRSISLGRHYLSAACLLFVLAATASAYSIVMRGGKRIEIPAQFDVTSMTLTYEAGPGFWVTLQMAAIDIPATERANKEVPGSLMARANAKVSATSRPSEFAPQASEPRAKRSVTNRELESFQRVRVESERAYDQRLKDQGLPSLAQMRADAAADAEKLWQEQLRQRAEAEANDKASQLQAQIAALSAQLNELQSRSAQFSPVSADTFTVYGGAPFFGGRSRVNRALFRTPFGLPVGGAFGSFNVPIGPRFDRHGGRIILPPGRHIGGRGGFRGGHRGPSRSR